MRLGSCVQFDEKVFAHSPDYDAYRGEIFEVIAFRHNRTHVELRCLSNPALIVQGLVHPTDLKSVPRKTTKAQQMKGRKDRQKTKRVDPGDASRQIKPPLKAQIRAKIRAKIKGSMSLSKGSIVPQSDRDSPPNQMHHVSARTLRAMKRKAQARDHASPAGEERLLIRPAQLRGAKVIWPDVDLTDKPPAKEGSRPRRDVGKRQFKSGVFEVIHEAAAALHKVGAIDTAALLKKVRGRAPMGNPNASTNVASRIKAKHRGKSVALVAGAEFSVALGAFLDDWEKEHGPLTAVELARAGKELAALEELADTELLKTAGAPNDRRP